MAADGAPVPGHELRLLVHAALLLVGAAVLEAATGGQLPEARHDAGDRGQALAVFAIGAVALALSLIVPGLEALRVLGLTGLIAGVAFMPGPALNAAAWGDVSYGVYITHFPILQALVAMGVFSALGPIGGLALSTALVFAASYALWWWVEKPALRADSHYRKAASN